MRKGFSLIELMVVMTVIAVLATLALYGLNLAQQSARDAARVKVMSGIQTALEQFYRTNQSYPVGTTTNPPTPRFCEMMCVLVRGAWGGKSYMSMPVDPSTRKEICDSTQCGPVGTTCSGNGQTSTCGGATYSYTSTGSCTNSPWTTFGDACQNFVLTLTKESGGTSTFTNPQ